MVKKRKEKKRVDVVGGLFKNHHRKKNLGISLNLRVKDYNRVRRLLFMGIVLKVRLKKSGWYKVWVSGFSHHYAKARTPLSAYRKLFKKLIEMGIYLP